MNQLQSLFFQANHDSFTNEGKWRTKNDVLFANNNVE